MLLWRISNYADLIGTGGLLFPGRWHSAGRPIVYLAESPAGALVEILVHLDRDNLPGTFQLIGVETGDMTIDPAPPLVAGWETDVRLSRAAGDDWLGAGRAAALRAPSAILPHTWNVLLNPQHSEAALARIVSVESVPLDSRLT